MSRGNAILGYGRGAVGDVVLTVIKGQQVSRARNRFPKNPKTRGQMRQRSGFVSPLKFYTRGVQNLYRFAFSDKRHRESDYNAFMRANIGAGFPLTPTEFAANGFPALGRWKMSSGALVAPSPSKVTPHGNSVGIDITAAAAIATVGDVSKYLISQGLADAGDQYTFALIVGRFIGVDTTRVIWSDASYIEWHIVKMRINPNDTTNINATMSPIQTWSESGHSYMGVRGQTYPVAANSVGLAVIRSKKTSRGLEVSEAHLINGGWIDEYIAFRNTPAQIELVLEAWKAAPASVLSSGT